LNQFFQSPRRQPPQTAATAEYDPRDKTVTAAYIHKTLTEWFLGLKDQAYLYRTCFLPKLPSLLPIFNNWHWKNAQNVLSAPLLPYFTPQAFYLYLRVKSELASCLLTQGTFKKSR
jgi:hypothetical protein